MKKYKKNSLNKPIWATLMIGVMVMLISISMVSALDLLPNKKAFDKDVGEYGMVTIKNSIFGIDWLQLNTLETIQLLSNTEVCNGNSCEAVKEIEMFSKGKLIDDVRFIDMKTNEPTNIKEYKFQYKLNGKWIDYNYEEVEKGVYEIRLVGELKDIFQVIDWQIKSGNCGWIEEWASWSSSLNTDLVSYYNFDETSGTNLIDIFNGSNNGTASNSRVFTTEATGIINTGGDFISGDNINMADTPWDSVFAGNFSMNFWLKLNTIPAGEVRFMEKWYDGSTRVMALGIQGDGKLILSHTQEPTVSTIQTTGTKVLSVDTWYNIILTKGSFGKKVYVNGDLTPDISSAITQISTNNANMSFGVINSTMDEVGIWNRSLTDSEITQLYNSGAGIGYLSTTSDFEINLISPNDASSTIATTIDFTSNGTITNGNFTNATLNVYYSNSSLFNTNFTTISGEFNTTSLNISTFTPGNYYWNYYYCALNSTADTICDTSSSNRTFTTSSFSENSQTYNVNTTETSIETFSINITYDSTKYNLGTGILYYNGTSYLGSSSTLGTITTFTRDVPIPIFNSNQTVDFNWKFSFAGMDGTFSSNSTTETQNVAFLNSSIYNAPYTNPFINFTFYDEKTLELLNISFSSNFNYGINTISKNLSYGDTSITKSAYSFAFDPSYLSYLINGNLEYSSPLYNTKSYTLPEQLINSTTTQVNLYLLNSSESTSFIIKVRDSSYSSVSGAIVHVQRYYPATNSWLTTEILTTNSEGKALGHFKTEDVSYRFLVYVGGELVLTSTSTKVYCESSPCTITLTISGGATGYVSYANLTSLDYTLSYSKTTEDFTYSYVDTSTDALGGRLKVIWSNFGNSTELIICDTTSSATTEIITCDLSGQINGTYIAFAYNNRTDSGEKLVNTLIIHKDRNIVASVGVDGVLWAMFFIMGIVMLGLFKPQIAVVFSVVGLIFVSLLGIISVPAVGLIAIIVLGIIILWSMKNV